MKFDVDDKNRCRLVCVKFHLNRSRFAVAVAKCLGGHFFGTQCICELQTVVCYCIIQTILFIYTCIVISSAVRQMS